VNARVQRMCVREERGGFGYAIMRTEIDRRQQERCCYKVTQNESSSLKARAVPTSVSRVYISTVFISPTSLAGGLLRTLSTFLVSLFSFSLPKLVRGVEPSRSSLGLGVSIGTSFSTGAPFLCPRSVWTRIGAGFSSATLASGLEMGMRARGLAVFDGFENRCGLRPRSSAVLAVGLA